MKPGRKPPAEPYHQYTLRLPRSLWARLEAHAAARQRSVRSQVQAFVETGLLGSPVNGANTVTEALPWLDQED